MLAYYAVSGEILMANSIPSQVFDVLQRDLVKVRPELIGRNVVLCPICLREISEQEVIKGGAEHIIPRNVIRKDDANKRILGSKNQRCGITVLCRTPRICQSNGKLATEGCNGLKGQIYDRLFADLLDDEAHDTHELTCRHKVAILVMAYLGAFQIFGYSYILRNELNEVRKQFDFPEEPKTKWLNEVYYNPSATRQWIVVTNWGSPFVVGSAMTPDSPLQVLFRRCQAELPPGHLNSPGVDLISLLTPDMK